MENVAANGTVVSNGTIREQDEIVVDGKVSVNNSQLGEKLPDSVYQSQDVSVTLPGLEVDRSSKESLPVTDGG